MITPKEFEERMLAIEKEFGTYPNKYGLEEDFHVEADALMKKALIELGYKNGVDIFDRNKKWYS